MTASRVDQVTYEGQWAAYQKDYHRMSLASKIDYCEELNAMAEEFRHYQKKRWSIVYWAFFLFPCLTGLLFLRGSESGKAIAYLVVAMLFVGIGYLFLLRSFSLSKNTKRMFPILVVGYSILSFFQPNYVSAIPSEKAILCCFLIGTIISIAYWILAGSGFSELQRSALAEKSMVEEEIRSQLYSGMLNPIHLKTIVNLEKGENAYLEVPAVLMKVEQKNPYFQNFKNNVSSKATQYISLATGEKVFSKGMRKAWEQIMLDSNQFVQDLSKNSKKEQYTHKNLMGSLGSCIITDDRVLFITQTNGFQIFLADLTAYYAQDGDIKTLVLQSSKGQRALEVEAAPWAVLLLDRLKRRV